MHVYFGEKNNKKKNNYTHAYRPGSSFQVIIVNEKSYHHCSTKKRGGGNNGRSNYIKSAVKADRGPSDIQLPTERCVVLQFLNKT